MTYRYEKCENASGGNQPGVFAHAVLKFVVESDEHANAHQTTETIDDNIDPGLM